MPGKSQRSQHHFRVHQDHRHFNAIVIDASEAYVKLLKDGNKMWSPSPAP
jgi:hypothetical protein